jgi:hypothetical protein
MTLAQKLCVAVFLLPQLTAWLCLTWLYYLSPVDACMPYFSLCLGYWHIGVPDPLSFVFRAGLFAAVVVWLFWWYSLKAWLLLSVKQPTAWTIRHILLLGAVACSALLVSVALLRPEQAHILWGWQSAAVALFFIGMVGAHSRVIYWLYRKRRQWPEALPLAAKLRMLSLQWLLLAWWLVAVFLQSSWQQPLEWWLMLAVSSFPMMFWRDWRHFRLIITH